MTKLSIPQRWERDARDKQKAITREARSWRDLVKFRGSIDKRNLTLRERQVFEMLSKGLANKEIAHRLGIAERTAKEYVKNIFNKLGVSSRYQLLDRL
jgi:DNA-binding NarL/FixJ family response regulator